MPYEIHEERAYTQPQVEVFAASLRAVQKLGGKVLSQKPEEGRVEVKFDKTILGKVLKTILGKVLGDRTNLVCSVRADGAGSAIVVDAYPLDAVGRKLMFGARAGVTRTVVTWFIAHLENQLGMPPAGP